MQKVTIFMPEYSVKQQEILSAFAMGVPHARIRNLKDPYRKCDVAVIFGMVKSSYKATWAKKKVLDRHECHKLIVIDSSYVNRGAYYNIGFGGINGGADFRTEGVKSDRWQMLGAPSKPWHYNNEGPVVVCGQLPWDVAVQGTDHKKWCQDTVAWYKHRDVPVVFRPHPRITPGKVLEQYGKFDNDVFLDFTPVDQMLENARCVVTWNSNTAVDAAIAGVPVIAQDRGSGAYEVAAHELSDYNKSFRVSRTQWLAGIGYSQWTTDEMHQGMPFKHLMRGFED